VLGCHFHQMAGPGEEQWDLCYAFVKRGACNNKNCKWRHERSVASEGTGPPCDASGAGGGEFLEEHEERLGRALFRTLRALPRPARPQVEGVTAAADEKPLRLPSGSWDLKGMRSRFYTAIQERAEEPRLAPDRHIHVGMMDYMGEPHEGYRKELDFLETTNTWFDTDDPSRKKVDWLPEECGWQEPIRYNELAARIEDGFHLVVKVSHVATHLLQLEQPGDWWPQLWAQKYSQVVAGTAAFLWQFAPSFHCTSERRIRLHQLFEYLADSQEWVALRHIVDFRHSSWHREPVYELLRLHRVCLAWLHLNNTGWAGDLPSGWTPLEQTTDFNFIRLFGNEDRCCGWYDKWFLHRLHSMCPPGLHSYVLFGNKISWSDPSPSAIPCFLNARDFRAIFSKVDLVTRVRDLRYAGDCPRQLSAVDAQAVTFFFLRYSEKARRGGITTDTPVWVVDATKYYPSAVGKRSYEWRLGGDVSTTIHLSLHDAKEQEDVYPAVRQLTGMEDPELIKEVGKQRSGSLTGFEAELVNSTFVRFSSKAREAGVLRTTTVRSEPTGGASSFVWLQAAPGPLHGEPYPRSNWRRQHTGRVFAMTPTELCVEVAGARDVWEVFCELQRTASL